MSYTGRRKMGTTGYGTPYAIFTNQGSRSDPPTIIDSQGNRHVGQYLNSENGTYQFVYPDFNDPNPATIEHNGKTQEIPGFGQEFEGADIGSLKGRANKGPGGGAGVVPGSGVTGGQTQVGQYSYAPNYLGNMFPSAVTTAYQPIQAAPYSYTDPYDFGAKSRDFNVDQIRRNISEARQSTQQNILSELQGLKAFVPQASQLKRSEIQVDNAFNQGQRSNQVEGAIPGITQRLADQVARGETYARGEIPDAVADAARTRSVSSASADNTAAAGFGENSVAATKASKLLNTKDRLAVAQMGENQITQATGQQVATFVAPTEFSDAGGQVKVTPEIGAGRQVQQFLDTFNANTLIPTNQAFTSTIGQRQFSTNLEQGTRTFNATNTLQNDQFNATNKNNFALTKFQYDVGYAGTIAGAQQNEANTQLALSQQSQALQYYNQAFQQAQKNGDKKGLASILTQIVTALGGGTDLISGISGLVKGSKNQEADTGTTSSPTTNPYNPQIPSFGSQPSESTGELPEFGSGVVVAPGSEAPDGYIPVGANPDGSVTYMPDISFQSTYSSFQREIG